MSDQPTTGEWTAETVATHSWQKIADAHNAALAAEREVVFNLDKQVQEITDALITARQQLVAEREKLDKSDQFRERLRAKYHQSQDALSQAKAIIQQLREQLAAEQERGFREAAKIYKPARDDDRTEIRQLRQENITLVDVLTLISKSDLAARYLQAEAKDALAKVKERK